MNAKNGATREERFRRLMASRGINLIRATRMFRFRLTTYTPDFYHPPTDTFYEVLGSRQRAHAIRPTLDLMWLVYPDVRLEIRLPDASQVKFKSERRLEWLASFPWGNALHERMMREGLRFRDVLRSCGIGQTTFYWARRRPSTRASQHALAVIGAFAQCENGDAS